MEYTAGHCRCRSPFLNGASGVERLDEGLMSGVEDPQQGSLELRYLRYWAEAMARLRDDVRDEALKKGKAAQFGQVCQLCREKHSELERWFRKRTRVVVGQGSQVTGQTT